MRKINGLLVTLLIMVACSKSNDDNTTSGSGGDNSGGVTNVVSVSSDITVNLSTDKACYSPGETVLFTADNMPADAKIRYRALNNVMAEVSASGNTWTWTAPATDYTGYLVDVYRKGTDGSEVILGTIAVDVSSDWTRFPRYGFVATFDRSKSDETIQKEMTFLNRFHINGVQFQDWHNKHHWPLGGTRDKLDEYYTDIANREISTHVVKNT